MQTFVLLHPLTRALNCHRLLGGMQEKMNSANAAKASNRSREEAANQTVS